MSQIVLTGYDSVSGKSVNVYVGKNPCEKEKVVEKECPKYIDMDIMVIGAGISGLYLCYQAGKLGTSKSILCVEQASRVGGRLTSIPLLTTPSPGYTAEGCAQRYFKESDEKIVELLDELGISSVEKNNDDTVTGLDYVTIFGNTVSTFPIGNPSNCEISFPQAVTLTPNISTGSYTQIQDFARTSGYPVFLYPMNLEMAYLALTRITGPKQELITGGYIGVCNTLANRISTGPSNIRIQLDTRITDVEYDGSNYIVNQKWRCRKVVYTGPMMQFLQMNTKSAALLDAKQLLVQNWFTYQGLRLYLRFSQPWWRQDEEFFRFNGDGPINQFMYYSADTIVIYNNMYTADLLFDFLPIGLRNAVTNPSGSIQWYGSSLLSSTFLTYIIKYLFEYIQYGATISPGKNITIPTQQQLSSITNFAFRYNQNATQFCKPMQRAEYDAMFPRLNKYQNFYLISGDYSIEPGWVESCLDKVTEYLSDILL